MILDNLSKIKKLDKSNMAGFIAEFPQKCQQAYKEAQKISLSKEYKNVKNVIICALGGSAISGELSKGLSDQLKKPIIINRSENLPNSTDKDSLVVLISYSGNTQEVLLCGQEAKQRKSKIFIITQGGKLKIFGKQNNFPMFNFTYPAPPRAGLAYLLMPLLVIFEKIGLIKKNSLKINKKLQNFCQNLNPQTLTEKNLAKYLAYAMFDRLPIIIAPPELVSVAYRWKTQMAENAKSFLFFEAKPEIFHNFIESVFPKRLNDEFIFLIFNDIKKNYLNKKSSKILENFLKEKFCWEKVPFFGQDALTQTFSLILLGDWISFYLALLNEVDPSPVRQIKKFKKHLNE